jgi:hypothetical protein
MHYQQTLNTKRHSSHSQAEKPRAGLSEAKGKNSAAVTHILEPRMSIINT